MDVAAAHSDMGIAFNVGKYRVVDGTLAAAEEETVSTGRGVGADVTGAAERYLRVPTDCRQLAAAVDVLDH